MPAAIHTVDGDSGYSDDIKYKPGPRLPPPQPDEPKLQMTPYTAAYQYQYPHVSKTQKKTPVARTVPLSTLPLPGTQSVSIAYRTLNRVSSQRTPGLHSASHLRHTKCQPSSGSSHCTDNSHPLSGPTSRHSGNSPPKHAPQLHLTRPREHRAHSVYLEYSAWSSDLHPRPCIPSTSP